MLFILPALLLATPAESQDVPQQLKTFMDVYAVVEREAADPVVPEKALYGGAIPGMLRHLDPHSAFFDPDQFQQLQELQESTRKGFGSVVSILPGRVIVLQVLPGTPAARSGLAAGDEIVGVNNIPLAMLQIEQIVSLLSESRRQQARIDIRRPGDSRLVQLTLTPAELQTPSVDRAFLLRPGMGFIRVASFDAETGQEVQRAIDKLGGDGLRGLIIDLRDNAGGVVGAALYTASLFLRPEQKILTVRGRAMKPTSESVPKDFPHYQFPVAVLINGKTASACEIVAGALQDHDRAVIVGAVSYGKGLVESVYSLPEKTGLALTTAYYYTPSGRSIQRPLPGTPIAQDRWAEQKEYFTDSGRRVQGGGGIQPDYPAYPEPMSRFREALEASGWLVKFATEYTMRHHDVTDSFQVSPALLDQFQLYLAEHQFQPGISEWSADREWIRSRLKAEIFNQALGVERGDEVELQRDPVVLTALDKLDAPLRPVGTGNVRAGR